MNSPDIPGDVIGYVKSGQDQSTMETLYVRSDYILSNSRRLRRFADKQSADQYAVGRRQCDFVCTPIVATQTLLRRDGKGGLLAPLPGYSRRRGNCAVR
jgi:hypothetical protein